MTVTGVRGKLWNYETELKKSHEQMWQADAANTTSSLGLQQRRKSVYTFDKETNEKTACDGGSYRETKDQVAHL